SDSRLQDSRRVPNLCSAGSVPRIRVTGVDPDFAPRVRAPQVFPECSSERARSQALVGVQESRKSAAIAAQGSAGDNTLPKFSPIAPRGDARLLLVAPPETRTTVASRRSGSNAPTRSFAPRC